ncbi:MAG: calcium-binding protein, partial [Pseudomonadota bacterium]
DGYEAIDGTGNSQDNRIVGNGVDNVLTGEAGDDILIGSYGYNQLYGGMGKDTLDGRKGHSELYGGMDNDHYIIDSDTDIIIEALASGYDTVESSVSYILADNLESLQLTGSSAISGSGNSSDNNLLGNDAENQLSGQAGDDTIDGAAGNDWLEGNGGDDILYGGDDAFRRIEPPCIDMYWSGISGVSAKGHGLCEIPIIYKALPNNDYLDGGAGDDQLDGGTGDDELFGGAGQDELTGGTGNDLLDGGESLDIMAGGKGDDAYYVDGYAETILIPVEDDDEPVDVETRYCACDAISIGADENGKGNEGVGNGEDPPPPGHDDNWNDGVDTSPGNPGSKGGVNSKDNKDNDQYKQTDTESQAVSEASQNSPYTGNVTDTSEVSDPATYARQPKYIEETIYHTDTVIEQDGGGYDVVYASTTYALTDHVEELHLTGTQALDGTGNASNNRLYGNSADNVLDGGLGDDILQGGLGNDTYVIDSLYDVINETYDSGEDTVISSISYQLSDELEHLTLSGTQAINARGNQGDNSLTGNEADNTIAGGLGNDTLNGGQGNDLLDGGEGDDLYLFELGDGLDTVTDTSGIDRIVFGEGIDFDRVAVRTETVNGVTTAHLRMLDQYGNEQIDQGMDFSLDPQNHTASIESFEFADGSERSLDELLIQSLEHNGSKKQDNLILGRDDDLVWAGRGDDVVSSGTGNDILLGETGEDTLSGQGGIDLLVGGEGEDNLYGGGGNDLLFGGSNEDRLVGCHGNDLYVGGLGNDSLYLQCGDNLVLYNRGDGRDKLHLDEQVSGVTLSLGAGIALADLSLEKAEHDLILHIDGIEENELPSKDFSEGREDNKRGQGDTAIVLDDWYLDDASSESPALTLQIITEAQAAFEVNSTDPLLNQRIHQYDLAAVIQAFDEARVLGDQQDPWSITQAALDEMLLASDEEAIGGELAYRYGMNGGIDALGSTTFTILNDSRFAVSNQPLKPESL